MPLSPKFNVVLFDIDNVLIDTRASYLAAIQRTVEGVMKCPGIVSLKEIDQFKLLGGFNDDWDCSYGIVTFLQTVSAGKPLHFQDSRRGRLSISELKNVFPERPLGTRGLLQGLGRFYEKVETPSYAKIARRFQEVYWGRKGRPGLIRKERPIFSASLLKKIKASGVRFGIVTGRNRLEAEFALKRFGAFKYFDRVVTIDEVHREEKKRGKILRKPDPWSLVKAAEFFQKESRRELTFLYVGDLPDDVRAANSAKRSLSIRSAIFPKLTGDSKTLAQELKKDRPDFVLNAPSDLLKIVRR